MPQAGMTMGVIRGNCTHIVMPEIFYRASRGLFLGALPGYPYAAIMRRPPMFAGKTSLFSRKPPAICGGVFNGNKLKTTTKNKSDSYLAFNFILK